MSEYDTSGKGQKDRATEILARMGFAYNITTDEGEEWIMQDIETNSMISILFKQFEYDEGLRLGFWWISPFVAIDSSVGGRLAATQERYLDVELAASDERNSDEFVGNVFRSVFGRKGS